MAGKKTVKTVKKAKKGSIQELDNRIKEKLTAFADKRDGVRCYPLFLYNTSIQTTVVEDVFDDLRTNYKDGDGNLDVIVFSGGGDIDCAYNLALLFRRFAKNQLTFIVPRWAKSAATLLVCSGDVIMMSPIAELGPLDPQITEHNPLEQRLERFSPLHIEATLNLIRDEFKDGNEQLAKGLLERLQYPLTLGSFKKSLDIGKGYLRRLLVSRMLKGDNKDARAIDIAKILTEGYADHGFCINIDEAQSIGLTTQDLEGELLDIAWSLHKTAREKETIKAKQKQKKMEDLMKNMPPELRDAIPKDLKNSPE